MLHTLSVLINTTENTPLQFSQMLKQMVKWKKKFFNLNHLYLFAWQKLLHTFLLLSPPLTSLAPSVSCFLASSGSSKQESPPNEGIKRVREMTEKEKEKECGSQHPQIQSSGKKEGDSKRQCSFSERALSVFSSSSAPKCWSHKWCWGLRAVPAVCVKSKLKILLTRRYFMCSIFIKWL